MECEEDPNSLLSLPHTLLQSENGSTSVQSSEKQQQWLEGPCTEGTSSGINSQFSMISPSLTHSLTQGSSNQLLTNSSKYYGNGNGACASVVQSHHNISATMSYSRSDHRTLPNNFSSTRSSVCHSSSATSNAFDFNMTSVSHNDNDISEYYQTSSHRNNVNLYNNHGSVKTSNDNFENDNNHHFETAQTANPSILSHTNYDHDNKQLDESVEIPKPQTRHQQHQSHQTAGDIIEFPEHLFDSRSKHLEYSKDLGEIYNVSSTKTNVTFSHEVNTSVDKRQLEMNNLVPELDFSLGVRDFDPVSSSSNTRQEYAALHRSADLNYRLEQDQGNTYLNQDLPTQKYSVSSSQSFDMSINNARKMSTIHSGFPSSQNIDSNLYSGRKTVGEHVEMSFVHKEQVAEARSLDRHRFSAECKKGQESFIKEENESLANLNAGKVEEKWSGRSRAHRKMARLLGQGLCKEKPDKLQDNPTNQMFSKKTQNLIEYAQDSSKSQETSRKYSYQEMNFRESPSSVRNIKNVERNVSSSEKLVQSERREEVLNRNQNFGRDYNSSITLNMSSSSTPITSMSRDVSSSLLSNQHLLSTTPALDLEFQQSLAQRDLELNPQFVLQVSKDLGMEENLTENENQVEFFSHHMDPHQLAPTNFPFSDNLSSQCPQEINLDSYLIPSDKDNFNKKFPYHNQRNLSTETEFNIEEYMEGQVDKDLTQAYFERTDVPQDMTMYQKTSPDKSASSYNSSKLKERDSVQSVKMGNKQNDSICELQKELTKPSSKESMKGVRIPRDINRAMEILQDLQETEKEEERRKKELQERQQQNEFQETQQQQQQQHQQQQHQHQQQQQQHQKYQHSSVNSSPKKTFQNKHQIESMALTEQQLLSMPTNFIDDQSVENVNFLDQSSYCFQDQSSGTAGFCDPSIQEISQYSGFSNLYQPSDVDVASLSKQRDYQPNTGYQLSQELDYHILKRLAMSAANSKEVETNMSLQQTSSNGWLAGNASQAEPDLHFNLGMTRLPEHLSLLNEGPSNKFTVPPSSEENRVQYHSEPYTDINSEQRPLEADKLQNFSSFGDGVLTSVVPIPDKTPIMDVMDTSRQNLYIMMKEEQLCDAVLSTSKVEVKVHQTILCSMSQYLSNLLLPSSSSESKSSSMAGLSFPQSSKFKNQSQPRSHYHHHHLVMLVINCENIKSSSISAFLMFIYLGKTEFSESNIVDLFILASSLHVLALKNLCLEFMWQAHIPEDQVKIPQLQISVMGLETRDQSCYANMGTKKSMEDKGVCVGRSQNMDVASQTDRTTCKVGGGGQEEWVMLKKTKQKTVSPSKSKIAQNVKGLVAQENQAVFKPGKKPWLSPKRRFKSELLAQAKCDPNNFTKVKDKDPAECLDVRKYGGEIEDPNGESGNFPPVYRNVSVAKHPRMIPVERDLSKKAEEENEDSTLNADLHVRHIKTTVEIAEAAAAAKISGHAYNSYQTRRSLRKSNVPVSSLEDNVYDTQETVLNHKDKSVSLKDKVMINSSHSKEVKKVNLDVGDLNKSTVLDSNMKVGKETHTIKETDLIQNISNDNLNTNLSTSCERPVKKKIMHQTFNNETSTLQPLNTSPKADEKSITDTNVFNATNCVENNADIAVINEGDLSHVSHFIDSIVNKMGSETEDAELQKVIHDLDSELYRPQTTIPVSSAVFPLASSSAPLYSSSLDVAPVETSSLSLTPVSSTVVKSKSTAQGFRKRLIQLVKSENLKLSLNRPDIESPNEKDRSNETNGLSQEKLLAITDLDSSASTSLPSENKNSSDDNVLMSPDLQQNGKDGVEETAYSACEKGKDPTVTDDYDTQFHHKIFKRKRKSKPRKTICNDVEGSSLKPKTKKCTGTEPEVSGVKSRQRRNTTSDTEGGGIRSKAKKAGSNELEGSLIRNVRPPPKKRAKMELEMLKVADGDNTKDDRCESDKSVQTQDDEHVKSDKENAMVLADQNEDQQTKDKVEEVIKKPEDEMKVKKPNEKEIKKATKEEKSKPLTSKKKNHTDTNFECKSQSDNKCKSPSGNKEKSDASGKPFVASSELSTECQYASCLQKLFAQSGLKTRVFSCKLCKSHLKSALVSVKHVKVIHKLQDDEILQNITVGYAENSHEACDICGYVTKDQTYKYMHYHKYFKHNVPLPLGLSIHKCHMCHREFQTNYQLNEHIKGHADDFSFTCWYCGQNFKSRNNMNNHVFHKHSKQRNHTCKVCDKAFKTWTQLKVHVRIHTGDRPFSCTECGYGSTTLGNMRHHLSHKHRMRKDEMEEAMMKISERKPEMTPAALDQLMDLILSQAIPDKAKKLPQGKGKSKAKLQNRKEEDARKSTTEGNMKKKDKYQKHQSKDLSTLASVPDEKTPLKKAVNRNSKITMLKSTEKVHKNGKIICSDASLIPSPQQKSVTIISQPVMANNIVIIPCTGHQTSKPQSIAPMSSQCNQLRQVLSTQEKQSIDGLHISEMNYVHGCVASNNEGSEGVVNTLTSKSEHQSSTLQQNSISANNPFPVSVPQNTPNVSMVQKMTQAVFTSPSNGNGLTLNAHQPLSTSTVFMPVSTLDNKTNSEIEVAPLSNVVSNQLGQCASNIVYANQPVMLQDPVMAGGSMYQGMPSFIMYSCHPNQSVLQIQGVSDLQIVPTTVTPGFTSSSGLPVYSTEQTIVNTQSNVTEIRSESNTEVVADSS